MNAKLLTDQALRDDLYIELMYITGVMAVYGLRGDVMRKHIEEQLDLLMPVVKKHIKRRVRAAKPAQTKDS